MAVVVEVEGVVVAVDHGMEGEEERNWGEWMMLGGRNVRAVDEAGNWASMWDSKGEMECWRWFGLARELC